GVQQARH
ncbi:fumarylacetoacetate (FAA) hydrolase family protein, partial [Vibrio parahaemolyticus AQ3810]